MSRRMILLITGVTFLLNVAMTYIAYMNEQGNFHPITPGEAYRSAQLDRDELEYYIKKYNIKSILNLRGRSPDSVWYIEETVVSSEHNINHYDIALSARKGPTPEDAKKLIEIFKSAPRPLLIHCTSGADRAGLVAAMWKVIVDKRPKTEAEKQLSIFYGHLPIGKTIAMDRFFQNWDPVSYSMSN